MSDRPSSRHEVVARISRSPTSQTRSLVKPESRREIISTGRSLFRHLTSPDLTALTAKGVSINAMLTDEAGIVLRDIKSLSKRPRPAGSKIERQVAKLVRDRLEERARFDTEVQYFDFLRYIPKEFSLIVQSKEAQCRPCLCSANTPRGGIRGQLARSNFTGSLSGIIALISISSLHESLEIEKAAEKGAIGAIVFQKNSPLLAGRAKYPISTIPAVSVPGSLGGKLWAGCSRKNIEVSFRVRSLQVKSTGINVLSFPKMQEPRTLFVAHRDSRVFSNGAIDNGSGTALLLYLADKNDSAAILSTDAEEYGLLGARHFVKAKILKKSTKIVNLDSIGPGHLCLIRRSRSGFLSRKLNQKIRRVASEELGLKLGDLSTVRGSDSDVFQENGFEACWIRSYPTPSATTIEDTVEKIPRRELGRACRLVSALGEAKL